MECGFAIYILGDNRSAISDFDTALKIRAHNPKLLYYKGLALEELKDYHGTLKSYQWAGELGEAEAYEVIQKYCN